MKKILVPVDFSECADNACDYAYRLAKATGASLRLMHVMYDPIVQSDLPGYGYTGNVGTTESVLYRMEIESRKSLRYLQERYEIKSDLEKAGLQISVVLRNGFPESEIAEECLQWEPDLILMGTHGRGRMAKTLLGSVSVRVIERVAIPVLAIPEGAGYTGISHMLYAASMDARDGANVCAINALFEELAPTVSCVHMIEDPNHKLQPWQYNTVKQELETLIRTGCPQGKLDFEVLEGHKLAEQLNSYIVEQDIDILAMAMHHRNLLEKLFSHSQTKDMLGQSRIPLLAMHT
jgi:nucleotide-binding universal stress UspA family protein